MVFSSTIFVLFFFPVFFTLYFLADRRFKNTVILLSSIFFFAWGAPAFIFLVLCTTFLDFHLVKFMDRAATRRGRIAWLVGSLSLNLGLLFYFKYTNFFAENILSLQELLGLGKPEQEWRKIVMPIGISFFTFESLTYVVDVYRKVHKPLKSFRDYQMYILLFPKLIAGPIIRFHDLADQITDRRQNDNIDNKLAGLFRFSLGLGKKVLLSNLVAVQSDAIFSLPQDQLTTPLAWIGILAYTFHIYFDFSGYSDMAIGMGRMMGFVFPENFNNPYTSRNITEFWRRWHMTLGSWMRNYLYIPLGGNRVKQSWRLYLNLWIVFLVSGFWHGAAWTFLLWGAFHGIFLILDRLFLLKVTEKIGRLPSMLLTFLIVMVGWVFFKFGIDGGTVADGFHYIGKMFSADLRPSVHMPWQSDFWFAMAVCALFSFWASIPVLQRVQDKVYSARFSLAGTASWSLVVLAILMVCAASITASGFNPFIYFRF
jgi:alginate O-acetyltransferase complex protein AlgI